MGWLSGLHISQICWINQCLTSRWCSDWWISSAHLALSITLWDKGEHREASDQYPAGEHRLAWLQPWDFSLTQNQTHTQIKPTHTHTNLMGSHTFTPASGKNKWQNKNNRTPDSAIAFLQPFFLLSSASHRAAASSQDAACSFWLLVEKRANPEWRAEPSPRETHVQRFILGSNQVANISSLHDHVYTWECTHACTRTHAPTHTHTSVWMGGFESRTVSARLLQQMAAGPRAHCKYGQQTHNCCQSREEWDVKGPKCPLQKQIRNETNDFIHPLNYQSNCKLSESFKGPAATARCSPAPYSPQQNSK